MADDQLAVGAVALRRHVGERFSRRLKKVVSIEFDQYFVVDVESNEPIGLVAKPVGSALLFTRGWPSEEEVDSICRQLGTGVEFQDEHGARIGTIVKPIPQDADGSWRFSAPGGPTRPTVRVERDSPILDPVGRPHLIVEDVDVDDDDDEE